MELFSSNENLKNFEERKTQINNSVIEVKSELQSLFELSNYSDINIILVDSCKLLYDEKFPPNQSANTAYKQRIVDYMTDNQENISDNQFISIANYVLTLDPVIERNMVRQANDLLFQQKMKMLLQQPQEVPAQPPNGGAVAQ